MTCKNFLYFILFDKQLNLDTFCELLDFFSLMRDFRSWYSPREVTWQGGAIIMVQCIMKWVNPAFGRNRKSIRIISLIPAFLVTNNSIFFVKTHTKNRGGVDM